MAEGPSLKEGDFGEPQQPTPKYDMTTKDGIAAAAAAGYFNSKDPVANRAAAVRELQKLGYELRPSVSAPVSTK